MADATHLRDEVAALAANQAFYTAFAAGDVATVLGSLSSRDDLVVMHPGWPALRGRRAVVQSWRDVCVRPPEIACRDAHAHLLDGVAAVVTCVEVIGDAALAATNVWVREADGWRLLHHQAAAIAVPAPISPPDDGDLYH